MTVSDVERGIRSTGVDELFALAIVLNTYVVKLIDPSFSGERGTGIDLGFEYPDGLKPEDARMYILREDDPWRLDRQQTISYADYREGALHIFIDRCNRERYPEEDECEPDLW